MAFSVNTNPGSGLAIRNLNQTNQALNSTQNNISTGKKVSSAKDNAAIFNIAQGLIGDVGGLKAVTSSLDRAISTTDVALAGGQEVSDLLITLKEKAVAASDPGLDDASRQALNEEFISIRDSIDDIVSGASFNGTNALAGDGVSAIANADGSETVSVAAQDLSLGGSTVTVSSATDLSSQANAKAAVAAVETSLQNVGSSLSQLGSGASNLEAQRTFTSKLSDAIEVGVGNLVDADLGRESASLAANQVKQQLGLQALSISNKSASSVLSLF